MENPNLEFPFPDYYASLDYFQRIDFSWVGRGVLPPVNLQVGNTCVERSFADVVTIYVAILSGRPMRIIPFIEVIQIIDDALHAFPNDLNRAYISILARSELRILSAQDLVDNAAEKRSKRGLSWGNAGKYLSSTGVCLESLYASYKRGPNKAHLEGLVTRVKASHFEAIVDPTFENVCEHIRRRGPLISTMDVTERFDNFKQMVGDVSLKEGVYTHDDSDDDFLLTSDSEKENHALASHSVVIVGFDLKSRSLLIKNSYGLEWGYLGFALVDFDCFSGFAYPGGLSIVRSVGSQVVDEVVIL